jgi:hypothetical protein
LPPTSQLTLKQPWNSSPRLRKIEKMNVVVLIGLLVLAAIAVQWNGVNFLWIGANVLIIGLLTYWIYARDKRRAEAGEWR